MAEAQTTKMTASKPSIPLPISRVPSGDANLSSWRQREQAKATRLTPHDPAKSKISFQGPAHSSPGSPWRLPQTAVTQPNSASLPPAAVAPDASSSIASLRTKDDQNTGPGVRANVTPSAGGQPPTSARQTAAQPSMGPVFTPSKQVPPSKGSPSNIRRVGYVVSLLCIMLLMLSTAAEMYGPHLLFNLLSNRLRQAPGCHLLLYNNCSWSSMVLLPRTNDHSKIFKRRSGHDR